MIDNFLLIAAHTRTCKLEYLAKEQDDICAVFQTTALINVDTYTNHCGERIGMKVAETTPRYIHFCGHSSKKEIALTRESICVHDFANIIDCRQLQFVYLNSCYTENAARILINKGVKAVIGTTNLIGDELASEVSVHFYKLVQLKVNVREAFEKTESAFRNKIQEDRRKRFSEGEEEEIKSQCFPWQLYGCEKAAKAMYFVPVFPDILQKAAKIAPHSDRVIFLHDIKHKDDVCKFKNILNPNNSPNGIHLHNFSNCKSITDIAAVKLEIKVVFAVLLLGIINRACRCIFMVGLG